MDKFSKREIIGIVVFVIILCTWIAYPFFKQDEKFEVESVKFSTLETLQISISFESKDKRVLLTEERPYGTTLGDLTNEPSYGLILYPGYQTSLIVNRMDSDESFVMEIKVADLGPGLVEPEPEDAKDSPVNK